jgi:hypothetical protein
MAHPAKPLAGAGTPFPVLDVDALLGRLPAEARARVVWARKPLLDGLTRLRQEPLTDDLLREVSADLEAPVRAVALVGARPLAAGLDDYRAAATSDFEGDEQRLASFLDDEDSRDTLGWITGVLRSFYRVVALAAAWLDPSMVDDAALQRVAFPPEAAPFMCGVVALMAAAEESRVGADRGRARELVDAAYLEVKRFRDLLRAQGVDLSPVPLAPVEQRRHRLVEAARRAREALTNEYLAVLAESRVADLR